MIDLGALLRVPCVDVEMGFDISPDGEKIAFSWNKDGHWGIYELHLKRKTSPHCISRGPGGKFHPRYSPNGKYLAYAVDYDGSENFHIFIHEFSTKKHIELAPQMDSVHQPYFAWSPDSRFIAFISDQAGQFNVYMIPIDGGDACLVLDAGHPAWKVRWSPDGSKMAVTVEASGIDYQTYIVPFQQGENVVHISDENGPIDAGQVSWSPEGSRLAFTSDLHGLNNIGIYDLATHAIEWLTDSDGEKQHPSWSQDGSTLAYVLNRGTVSWLAVQEFGKSSKLYQVEPGVHYYPEFTPDGKNLIFCFDNPRHPVDLWSLSLEDGKYTQLTHSMPEELIDFTFLMPEEITYPGLDGMPVPALLFLPSVPKPAPAVLIIHGGPDWLFEKTWYPLMANMASRGWIVLAPNYRGSTGYGREWQAASRFDFGGVDTDDVTAGALYLVREGLADPLRIGITGRSHGGYLTASAMTRYPELWAVGSAVVPFLNWFTNHEDIRPDLKHWDIENFGDPENNHDLWLERSPSFFLDRIRAPLQIICGGSDVRCPVRDSVEASNTLKKLGKDVDFVLYQDEGHAFLNLDNILDSEIRRVAFLAKYLEGPSSVGYWLHDK